MVVLTADVFQLFIKKKETRSKNEQRWQNVCLTVSFPPPRFFTIFLAGVFLSFMMRIDPEGRGYSPATLSYELGFGSIAPRSPRRCCEIPWTGLRRPLRWTACLRSESFVDDANGSDVEQTHSTRRANCIAAAATAAAAPPAAAARRGHGGGRQTRHAFFRSASSLPRRPAFPWRQRGGRKPGGCRRDTLDWRARGIIIFVCSTIHSIIVRVALTRSCCCCPPQRTDARSEPCLQQARLAGAQEGEREGKGGRGGEEVRRKSRRRWWCWCRRRRRRRRRLGRESSRSSKNRRG